MGKRVGFSEDIPVNYPHQDEVEFILQRYFGRDLRVSDIRENHIINDTENPILFCTRDHQYIGFDDVTIAECDRHYVENPNTKFFLYCWLEPGGKHVAKAVLIEMSAIRGMDGHDQFSIKENPRDGASFRIYELDRIDIGWGGLRYTY